MILRRPHEFKIATLQDVRSLFPPDWNPFYAGFGNRDTDEISYKAVRSFCAHSAWRRLSLGHHACDDAVPKSFPSSYHLPLHPPQVGVPPGRIFTINPKGELRKASVLVQSSALSSLRSINELVGNIFPPLPAHVRRVPPSGSAE